MRCAACVWLIERRVQALPGVLEVLLNVSSERLGCAGTRRCARSATCCAPCTRSATAPIPTTRSATASSSNGPAASCFASCSSPAWR
ncbi:hypothetical protein [Massilia sp. Se16.2.3]|uniref:hypothetical protein n=1 Tax=Massilia sp. Se16.2.3 TaxID=2709303 RepID=UPI001E44A750|nr:hypothetical protein [Massilia sp. Se16.2.3]